MSKGIKVNPTNSTAEALISRLEGLGRPAQGAFYNGNYCVTVPVKNLRDAFGLGVELGNNFGQFVHYDAPKAIVFADAHCQER